MLQVSVRPVSLIFSEVKLGAKTDQTSSMTACYQNDHEETQRLYDAGNIVLTKERWERQNSHKASFVSISPMMWPRTLWQIHGDHSFTIHANVGACLDEGIISKWKCWNALAWSLSATTICISPTKEEISVESIPLNDSKSLLCKTGGLKYIGYRISQKSPTSSR